MKPTFTIWNWLSAAAGVGNLLLATIAAAQPASLSPARWPAPELATFDSLTRTRNRPVPLAQGKSGIIAATTGAAAVRAGFEALKQGGSAMDAVLTHALADIVLMAQTVVTHAGIMTLVYYDASTGKSYAMNAGWNTVRDETDAATIPSDQGSGRAVLVPGFMRGAEAAHRRFGKLPWKVLFDPAIYFAEQGFPFDPYLLGMIEPKKSIIERFPESKAIFTRPDGRWYAAGDQFRQPALAQTLRQVAAEGASYMYKGAWAKKLVGAVRGAGGKMTMKDLESYEVIWSDPLRTTFRDYELLLVPPPTLGSVNLVEALNVVEQADLGKLGHYTNSAEAFDRLLGAARVGDVMGTSIITMLLPGDRGSLAREYLGDAELSYDARLTKPHARTVWAAMQTPAWRELERKAFDPTFPTGSGHSDAVVAADARGNVAALLHTSNATTWGRLGLLIDGVGISDVGSYQQPLIARTQPGSRLPDPTNPLIVLKGGRPVLASSSIGVGLHEQTLQSLVNILEYGLDLKRAGDTAQFFRPVIVRPGPAGSQSDGREPGSQVVAEGTFSTSLLDSVRAAGRRVSVVSRRQTGAWIGAWVGIARDPITGVLTGTSPGFLNGWALAY